MILQSVLIVLLAVLAVLCRLFYNNKMPFQQRLLSIFLIVWAILSIVYYDVWNYVTIDNPHLGMWYSAGVLFHRCRHRHIFSAKEL